MQASSEKRLLDAVSNNFERASVFAKQSNLAWTQYKFYAGVCASVNSARDPETALETVLERYKDLKGMVPFKVSQDDMEYFEAVATQSVLDGDNRQFRVKSPKIEKTCYERHRINNMNCSADPQCTWSVSGRKCIDAKIKETDRRNLDAGRVEEMRRSTRAVDVSGKYGVKRPQKPAASQDDDGTDVKGAGETSESAGKVGSEEYITDDDVSPISSESEWVEYEE